MRGPIRVPIAVALTAAAAAAIPANGVSARSSDHPQSITHVLLISADGLHQSDLRWYVHNHLGSELAKLTEGGREYTRARTPIPSDSFPGMVGQVTGGDPRVTGVYYDAEYNHDLLPPGTGKCIPGEPTGTPVNYDESIDEVPSSIDAGQGLAGLPGSILQMTGKPQMLINPAALPVDPASCKPVYPHQYLKVNTIFEVARAHGLRTAWSDKHPAYEILDGPSGKGIQDLFTPEVNSDAIGFPAGDDWTSDNAATMQYDSYKVQAVINEIDGYDHSRTHEVGVPAIFGINFQTVSTAEKLPSSDGLTGGYEPGTRTPGPLLERALDYLNAQLEAIDDELHSRGLADSTAIILSAKHGQSPQDPNDLTRIDDGPIVDAINAAWTAAHPGTGNLIVGGTDDDAIQFYLSDRSQQAAKFVRHYLLSHSATGNTVSGGSRTLPSSGLKAVFAGQAAASYFGVSPGDPRHPDVWGVVQHGVVYTGGKGKIAEHGGANPEDRDVALAVYAPSELHPGEIGASVETTQIAPTILRLLGLDPAELKAVRVEGTRVLPGA
jgi:Type I phosphodiesterase / nucleotide pyrophosphatase